MIFLKFRNNTYRLLIIIVFLLAGLLRFSLSIVNCQANDNHFKVIKIIKDTGKIPTKEYDSEGFQPKLYHLVAAIICKISPFKQERIQIIMAQLLNCLAGIITIYIVWLFLTNKVLSEKTKLICFSITALNPKLIGINAQATNDSFVIMFSTATLYCVYYFFKSKKYKYFLGLTGFSILAGLSKGNGLVLFLGILVVFILKLIVSKNLSLDFKKSYLPYILVFSFIYLAIVPMCGQYYYNYRQFGSPFVINQNPDLFPNLFQNTYIKRPGVTSIASAYFTFRVIGIIKNPVITNDNKDYPLHRTSLWSQLYGRTHFVFFDKWPLSWRTENAIILNIGRIILVLALIPTFILSLGIVMELGMWIKNIVKAKFDFIVSTNDWIFDVFLFGYILFIIIYTLTYRDFSSMKAIFIFPALLPAVNLFSRGVDNMYRLCGKRIRLTTLLDLSFGLLLFLYFLTMGALIYKLSNLFDINRLY